jgi:UDP-glucose 4-epimerase
MSPGVVLVTGVSRYLGGRLTAALAEDTSIERIIGVDVAPPRHARREPAGRAEFVRADIRNPVIAKVIADAGVDTVVHLSLVPAPQQAGGRSAMKEINVIGTMQLLAACQKAPTVRRLVVGSTAAVYGSSPRDPALFTEDMEPRALPRSGYGKDAVEVEGYVRGFCRRRPDVETTTLRFTDILGRDVRTSLTRYLSLPVVPTVLGFDPRLQLCHPSDALAVLRRAVLESHPGTFNVAGQGVLLLSQAVRRAGRATVPVPMPALAVGGRLFRRTGLVDFSPEQLGYLEHGRALDTGALRTRFGYLPRYTTMAAFDDFASSLTPVVPPGLVDGVERRAVELVGATADLVSAGTDLLGATLGWRRNPDG